MLNNLAGLFRWLFLFSLPAVILACTGCRPAVTAVSLPVKIGSPQGAGGLLVSYAASKMQVKTEVTPFMEVTAIQDCCSSYAQWALSSRSVDAAVICVDAARSLVEKDPRYTIIGPCLVNSDLLVVRDPAKVQIIGIVQNHQYQQGIVTKALGPACQVKPMMSTALAYAYTRGDVDGIVIDIEEALRLSGSRIKTAGENADLITYVLVASLEFQALPGFNSFLAAFRESAVELNDRETLQKALEKYSSYPVGEKEADQWVQTGIRFMAPN
jgi:hypothetical protein